MTSYLLVVNPTSGRGRARGRAERLRQSLATSHSVDVVETQRRGSAADIAAGHVGQVDRVIAVGGDGTLNEVLTGLMRVPRPAADLPALGFLPSGTANAAVRAFGFSSDPIVAARSFSTTEGRLADVGIVRFESVERPYLLWFGAGYDAVMIGTLNDQRTGRMGIGGLTRHTPAVLRAIAQYPAPEIEVVEGGVVEARASSVILANVGRVAFGGAVVDTADPFDGRLDLVALPRASKWRLATMGLRMLTSSLHRARGATHRMASEVRLHSDGRVPCQLDGEPVGTLPATVRVQPGAIRLLVRS